MRNIFFLLISLLSVLLFDKINNDTYSSSRIQLENQPRKKKHKTSTVRCKAYSKSSKQRCKNMTSNSSGYCRVHGG